MDDKIIVTNRSALLKKYGSAGVSAINKAVTALKKADKKRGIITSVVYLDDKAAMQKIGGQPVANALDPRQNKKAIDCVYKAFAPDYLMILGATDVIPHQDLRNPAYDAGNDDDAYAYGDLPYACDGAYSKDPAAFIGPTRVVGRLPDLKGAKEPAYLLSLLKNAAGYRQRALDEYRPYFALSAHEWKLSTEMSIDNIFGNTDKVLLSPKAGPQFPGGELKALMHFINCHGGPASPEFYGQKGNAFPTALTTQTMAAQIGNGSIAAVECCYGGQLYDAATLSIDMPICQSYLRQGGYAYLGSTTIAYGPADDNGAADLICQYFLSNILNGESTGLAALMARQQFVSEVGQMDPIDLKTIAQFCLLGDPSIHPIASTAPKAVPTRAGTDTKRFLRSERRAKLKLAGEFLKKSKPTASEKTELGALSSQAKTALANIARDAGLASVPAFTAFVVRAGASAKRSAMKRDDMPSRYLVAVTSRKAAAPETVFRGIAIVAKELNGRIIDHRVYYQR